MDQSPRTTSRRSVDESRGWPRVGRPGSAPRRRERNDDLDTDEGRTRRALQFCYRIALPKLRAERHANNGFSAPSYNRLVNRTYEFFEQMAQDIIPAGRDLTHGFIQRLRNAEDVSGMGEWRRIERSCMMDAAVDLIMLVETLPVPVQEVLVMVSAGLSVKQACRRLRDRASFSVADDYSRGIRMVWAQGARLVDQLI